MSPGKPKRDDKEYPTWGGPRQPRPGRVIGRPPVPDNEKRQTVCVSLPRWLVRWLKARNEVTKESTSAAVERALVEHYRLGPEEGEATK